MKNALLLIDIQNDYFENGANPLDGSLLAGNNASLILNRFREKQLPIIHIQHIANRPSATFFIPNTYGANIHSSVAPNEGEAIITKHFPNSFRETPLLNLLHELGIEQLTICGMMTHMCVDATTRAAKDFGFECTLIHDACATKELTINGMIVRPTDVHNSFVAALSYYYATTISTQEWLQKGL